MGGAVLGGFHPALALVPNLPFMPRGPRDLGLFDPSEPFHPDTLNQFERRSAVPVQFVLLLFGFPNTGVPSRRLDRAPTRCWQRSWWGSRSASSSFQAA
jgi:NhaA family Na+:H+ antiporter